MSRATVDAPPVDPSAGGTRARPGLRARIPLALLRRPAAKELRPTWQDARPGRIAAALDSALSRSGGGWLVVAPAQDVASGTSRVFRVDGREIVLWRTADGRLQAGPGACPHLGAALDSCPVIGDTLRCRWHGMAFPPEGRAGWPALPAFDDGVLAWVRVPGTEAESPRPVLPERPPLDRSITAVVSMTGRCEPRDVVANRLDPWHGAWFHPYAFSHLTVDEDASTVDRLVVDVAFRLGGRVAVPVRAEFVCPDARTIVMRIVEGEGAGSVVETHATPLGPGPDGAPLTRVTEATVAYSDRTGFRVATRLGSLVRPAMRHSARRLWVDDLAYAERRYAVRAGEVG